MRLVSHGLRFAAHAFIAYDQAGRYFSSQSALQFSFGFAAAATTPEQLHPAVGSSLDQPIVPRGRSSSSSRARKRRARAPDEQAVTAAEDEDIIPPGSCATSSSDGEDASGRGPLLFRKIKKAWQAGGPCKKRHRTGRSPSTSTRVAKRSKSSRRGRSKKEGENKRKASEMYDGNQSDQFITTAPQGAHGSSTSSGRSGSLIRGPEGPQQDVVTEDVGAGVLSNEIGQEQQAVHRTEPPAARAEMQTQTDLLDPLTADTPVQTETDDLPPVPLTDNTAVQTDDVPLQEPPTVADAEVQTDVAEPGVDVRGPEDVFDHRVVDAAGAPAMIAAAAAPPGAAVAGDPAAAVVNVPQQAALERPIGAQAVPAPKPVARPLLSEPVLQHIQGYLGSPTLRDLAAWGAVSSRAGPFGRQRTFASPLVSREEMEFLRKYAFANHVLEVIDNPERVLFGDRLLSQLRAEGKVPSVAVLADDAHSKYHRERNDPRGPLQLEEDSSGDPWDSDWTGDELELDVSKTTTGRRPRQRNYIPAQHDVALVDSVEQAHDVPRMRVQKTTEKYYTGFGAAALGLAAPTTATSFLRLQLQLQYLFEKLDRSEWKVRSFVVPLNRLYWEKRREKYPFRRADEASQRFSTYQEHGSSATEPQRKRNRQYDLQKTHYAYQLASGVGAWKLRYCSLASCACGVGLDELKLSSRDRVFRMVERATRRAQSEENIDEGRGQRSLKILRSNCGRKKFIELTDVHYIKNRLNLESAESLNRTNRAVSKPRGLFLEEGVAFSWTYFLEDLEGRGNPRPLRLVRMVFQAMARPEDDEDRRQHGPLLEASNAIAEGKLRKEGGGVDGHLFQVVIGRTNTPH
ncbi:unnamed protein product [Amoebophrya sp. A120]|nr:unnamed protein product [Amoebophrya sp. A120]|eukprot:GSA120T00009776001.1